MKMTKRILAFAMTALMLLSLSAAAFADGQFKVTQDFIGQLTQVDGFSYTLGDVRKDSSGVAYEPITVTYAGGDLSKYKSNVTMLFCENGEEVQLYMYNLVEFNEGELVDVLKAINDFNANGTGVKLYADLSDNTVTAEMYMMTTPETCVDIALTALGFMIGYTDAAYEGLTNS